MTYDTGEQQTIDGQWSTWSTSFYEKPMAQSEGSGFKTGNLEDSGTEPVRAKLVMATFSWLEQVYSLVAANEPDRAIDVLFENTEALSDRQCDLMLRSADVERLDTHLLVGILSITLERRARLPHRDQLVKKTEARLRVLAPERLDGLLAGLR